MIDDRIWDVCGLAREGPSVEGLTAFKERLSAICSGLVPFEGAQLRVCSMHMAVGREEGEAMRAMGLDLMTWPGRLPEALRCRAGQPRAQGRAAGGAAGGDFGAAVGAAGAVVASIPASITIRCAQRKVTPVRSSLVDRALE